LDAVDEGEPVASDGARRGFVRGAVGDDRSSELRLRCDPSQTRLVEERGKAAAAVFWADVGHHERGGLAGRIVAVRDDAGNADQVAAGEEAEDDAAGAGDAPLPLVAW